MRRHPALGLPGLCLFFALSGAAHAQRPAGGWGPADTVPPAGGGTYHGPGDTVPGQRDRVRRRPPSSPTAGPDQPELGSGLGRGVASAHQICTGAQFDVSPDFTTWQHWWRHNAQGYLNLKARLHTTHPESGSDTFFLGQGDKLEGWGALVPSLRQKREEVVPALLAILGQPQSPTLHREALLALARVTGAPEGASRVDRPSPYAMVIESYLPDSNLFLVEGATVSLGVLGEDSSVPSLVGLLEDSELGRELVDGQWVPLRVRACAAYGLGLIGRRTASEDIRRTIVEHLIATLNSPHFATRDVKVAAMTALGMTPLEWPSAPVGVVAPAARSQGLSRLTQIEFLIDYFDPDEERANRTRRHWFVRSHAATALARLAHDAPGTLRDEIVELLLAAIAPRSSEPHEVRQSCVLALGALGDADASPGSVDARIRAALTRTLDHGDTQSRRFALIALAQSATRPGQDGVPYAGLDEASRTLLAELATGPTQMKPWAALSLGILGYALQENAQPVDADLLRALRKSCADNRRPAEAGAHMLALGLLGDTESVEVLTAKLDFFTGMEGPRGTAAVAIGLAGGKGAVDQLYRAMEDASFRPALAENIGIGLRLCGDQRIVPQLARNLRKAAGYGSQLPIARALGQVGDSRAIPDMVAMLDDETVTDWARAVLAAALGSICDKDLLPWTYHISAGTNYRATTATLTTPEGLGVLDYL